MALGMEVFNSASQASVGTLDINLNTSGPNRIALIFVETDGATRRTVSSVTDTNSLTWAKYKSLDFDSEDPSGHKQRLEIWWAFAAVAQVANPVTVTLSGSANGIGLAVGAISGVPATRWAAPFDADPSLPVTATNPSATPADATVTFSTHDTEDAALLVWGAVITNQASAAPAGYSALIELAFNGASAVKQKLSVYGKVYNAQQTSISPSLGSLENWGLIAAAVGGTPIFPHGQAVSAGF